MRLVKLTDEQFDYVLRVAGDLPYDDETIKNWTESPYEEDRERGQELIHENDVVEGIQLALLIAGTVEE